MAVITQVRPFRAPSTTLTVVDEVAPELPARRWPTILAVVAVAVYVGAAIWFLYGLHYAIGDALARSANARYVIDSRDPHLGAIGFVWLPLPILGQLPFMAVLSHLHRAELSGPMFTAVCGGLTVLVLARLADDLGLSRRASIAFVATYAFNPVVIYYAANGMSEAPSFLFLALALRGFIRWSRSHVASDLVMLAVGLAGGMLVRYEVVGVTAVLACAAALQLPAGPRLRTWVSTVTVAALPAAICFGLWLVTSWLLMRDPFYWSHVMAVMGRPPANASWLPAHRTLATALVYAGELTVRLAPGMIVLALAMLLPRGRHARVTALGILGTAAVFPAFLVATMAKDQSWGNPRYFAPLIVVATVGSMWLASRVRARVLRPAAGLFLVAMLLGTAVASTWSLTDRHVAAVEGEWVVFRSMFGDEHARAAGQPALPRWRSLVTAVDPLLEGGRVIAVDAATAFPAVLLSKHPRSWIVSSDRDFEQLVAAPAGRIDFILRTTATTRLSLSFDSILGDRSGGRWVTRGRERDIGNGARAQLYQWIPSKQRTTATNTPIDPGRPR